MDTLFKALADPTRREILDLLKEHDLTPGDLLAHFEMTGASLSHHLQILRQAGLVTVRRSGQQRIYGINLSVFEQIVQWVLQMKQGDAPVEKNGGR